MEEQCLPICPLGLVQLSSYTAKASLPRGGSAHCGLGPLAVVIKQDIVPTDLPTSQSYESIFSIEILSSEMNLAMSSCQGTN